MTLADISQRTNFYTNTTTNQYVAADRLVALNNAIDKVHTMILESQDEWNFDDSNKTDLPTLTTSLVASQADYGLPTSLLKANRAEITYDGTTWKQLQPIDKNEITGAISSVPFTTSNPFYDIEGNSVILYPTPTANVTGGLKLWISRNVTAFTSSDVTTGTATPGFDRNFHEIVPLMMSYDWALAKGGANVNLLQGQIQDLEGRLRRHYGTKQKDRSYAFAPLMDNFA